MKTELFLPCTSSDPVPDQVGHQATLPSSSDDLSDAVSLESSLNISSSVLVQNPSLGHIYEVGNEGISNVHSMEMNEGLFFLRHRFFK